MPIKPLRLPRGLQHIKTACSFLRPRGTSPNLPLRGGCLTRQVKSKSSYKPRIISSSAPQLLAIQECHELTPELLEEGNRVNVRIKLPRAIAKSIQLSLRGDILAIQGETCYAECLLPCEVQDSIDRFYQDEILCITLKKGD